jgi:PPOX class probable F420-dependent enzyme
MGDRIEGRARELIDAKNFCHVATNGKDGRPDAVLVWVDTDGEDVLLNGAEGRVWPANLRRDPRVKLTVLNLENPYEYVTIDGDVIEVTPEGADDHINRLSKKYIDQDEYPFRAPGEVRLLVRVRPLKTSVWGGG